MKRFLQLLTLITVAEVLILLQATSPTVHFGILLALVLPFYCLLFHMVTNSLIHSQRKYWLYKWIPIIGNTLGVPCNVLFLYFMNKNSVVGLAFGFNTILILASMYSVPTFNPRPNNRRFRNEPV